MAQGQIRKGFFFYFGLLILLLFAVVMICVVVMIFNPGQKILWMQYFTGKETYFLEETTDETKAAINWENITDLEINCSYANVTVERNNNLDYKKDGLYIINNAKGLAGAGSDEQFKFSATFEGTKLVVDVDEPEGFLYFSKDIKIILHATTIDDNDTNFGIVNMTVNTTDGDVSLGGGYQPLIGETLAQLNSANITTTSGDIDVTQYFDPHTLTSLNFTTSSGKMTSSNKVTVDGKNSTGLDVGCDVSFTTDKGNISYDTLCVGGKTQITCKSGNIVNDYLYSKDGISFISSAQGNYIFGEILGDLELVSSTDTIISPNLRIGKIEGEFVLSAGEQGNPDVEIGEITKYLSVTANKGNLVVGKAHFDVEVVGEGGLTVDVKIADGNNGNISIDNKSGAVKLAYLGNVSRGVNSITTESGTIGLYVTSDAKFEAYMYLNEEKQDGEGETQEKVMLPDNKVKVNIGDTLLRKENPRLVLGENGGRIDITTNSSVSVNWVTTQN